LPSPARRCSPRRPRAAAHPNAPAAKPGALSGASGHGSGWITWSVESTGGDTLMAAPLLLPGQ